MNRLSLFAAAALIGMSCAAQAQPAPVKRVDRPTTTISNLVTVPPGYALSFISGTTAGSGGTPIPPGSDTKAQTIIIYEKFKSWLAAEGLGMGDIVMMRVFLVADPKTGQMDTKGANDAYNLYFGTAAQPKKPARLTLQVVGFGGQGSLVEIEAQVAHPMK